MRTTNVNSAVQLSLFPQTGSSVKGEVKGSLEAARLSDYMKTRGALVRLLMTYPGNMPLDEAIALAHTDFTKCRKGGKL